MKKFIKNRPPPIDTLPEDEKEQIREIPIKKVQNEQGERRVPVTVIQPQRSQRIIQKIEGMPEPFTVAQGTMWDLIRMEKAPTDSKTMKLETMLNKFNIGMGDSNFIIRRTQNNNLMPMNWMRRVPIEQKEFIEAVLMNTPIADYIGVSEEELDQFQDYIKQNIQDFHSIPLRSDNDDDDEYYLGGRIGERLTMFTPSIWFMDDYNNQSIALTSAHDLSERIDQVKDFTGRLIGQQIIGGNTKEYVYMHVTAASITIYQRVNGVQDDLITELPLYKKYQPGSSQYRETVMQLINNLTGGVPRTTEEFEQSIKISRLVNRWVRGTPQVYGMCTTLIAGIICYDISMDIMTKVIGNIRYNNISLQNDIQKTAYGLLTNYLKFTQFFNPAPIMNDSQEGLRNRAILTAMVEILPISFGGLPTDLNQKVLYLMCIQLCNTEFKAQGERQEPIGGRQTSWILQFMNMTPVLWIIVYYTFIRRIIQLYAAIQHLASVRQDRFHMIHYAMMLFIEEVFFIRSTPVLTELNNITNNRLVFHKINEISETAMLEQQALRMRVMVVMFHKYQQQRDIKKIMQAVGVNQMLNGRRSLRRDYVVEQKPVLDHNQFTDSRYRNAIQQQYFDGFVVHGYDRLMAYIKNNNIISAINSNSEFSGVSIYRGTINGDQMSAVASALEPEQLREMTGFQQGQGQFQRGVVFMVLFAALMGDLRNYQELVRDIPVKMVEGRYLVMMQIVMHSIYDIDNPSPDQVLITDYAEQRFQFRTIPIRFELQMNSDRRFTHLKAYSQNFRNPIVAGEEPQPLLQREIEISTQGFRQNRGPMMRLFISQIMEMITKTILSHVDQSDLHNYQELPENQPEYVDPSLIARVTQYTTFIMPLDPKLNADDMFKFSWLKDLQIYKSSDAMFQNEYLLKSGQLEQFTMNNSVGIKLTQHNHPADSNCVVIMYAYLMIQFKQDLELQDFSDRLDNPDFYKFINEQKAANLYWFIQQIEQQFPDMYQCIFIIDYCQMWVRTPKKMQVHLPYQFLQDEKLQKQTRYFAAVNLSKKHIHLTTPAKIQSYILKVSRHYARSKYLQSTTEGRRFSWTRPEAITKLPFTMENKHISIQSDDPAIDDNLIVLDFETTSKSSNSIKEQKPMLPYCFVVVGQIMGKPLMRDIMGESQYVQESTKQWFQSILDDKQNTQQISCYAHNGAQFDYVILLPWLLQITPDIQIYGSKTDIQKMSIAGGKIIFMDFRLLMSGSLRSIAESFNTQHQQEQCDEIQNVQQFSDLSQKVCQKIHHYCIEDCYTLLQCVKQFFKPIIQFIQSKRPDHKFLPTSLVLSGTAASLAEAVFRHCFLQFDIKGTSSQEVAAIESDAYFGGMTQVFNHAQHENIKYVDVNSLYPAAMRNIQISTQSADQYSIDQFKKSLTNPIGLHKWFLYRVTEFQFKEDVYGLLPVRSQDAGLVYPRYSSHPCWRTGTQLIALLEAGMMVGIVISHRLAYKDPQKGVFTNYIDQFYARQSEPGVSEANKAFYKLMLNSLYGKMGQRNFQSRVLMEKQLVTTHNHIINKSYLDLNATILSYLIDSANNDILSSDVQLARDLMSGDQQKQPYIPQVKTINDISQQHYEVVYEQDDSLDSIGSLKRIAMFTTGEARAIMIRAMGMLYQQNLMHDVYYMDTDSFFLSVDAFQYLRSQNMIDGKVLGRFKDQMKPHQTILRGQFIAPQAYFYEYFDSEQCKVVFQGQFKGIKQDKVQNAEPFLMALYDDNPGVDQQLWMRRYGIVFIVDTVKRIMVGSRRYVMPDGSTRCFQDCAQYEQYQSKRLRFDGVFKYCDRIIDKN